MRLFITTILIAVIQLGTLALKDEPKRFDVQWFSRDLPFGGIEFCIRPRRSWSFFHRRPSSKRLSVQVDATTVDGETKSFEAKRSKIIFKGKKNQADECYVANFNKDGRDRDLLETSVRRRYTLYLKSFWRPNKLQAISSFDVDRRFPENELAEAGIPKTIWTYWQGKESPIVNLCIKTLYALMPDYQVVILNPDNLGDYIERKVPQNFELLRLSKRADWVRVAVLAEHGGIWIDASILVHKRFDWLQKLQRQHSAHGVVSYLHNKDESVIESWFLSAVKGSPFFKEWADEFDYVVEKHEGNGERYSQELRMYYGDDVYWRLRQGINDGSVDYFAVFWAARKIQFNYGPRPTFIRILDAHDHGFKYALQQGWNEPRICKNLFDQEYTSFPTITKLTNGMRQCVDGELLARRTAHPKSIIAYHKNLVSTLSDE